MRQWRSSLFLMSQILLFLFANITLAGCHSVLHERLLRNAKKESRIPTHTAQVVREYQQQLPVSVQGLDLLGQNLYTSSGLYRHSFLRVSDLKSGDVMQKKNMDENLFAEGISIFHHKLYQLFWRSGKGFIYELPSLKKIGQFSVSGEGWGLTHDKHDLIMSNGSMDLLYLDPQHDFRVVKKVHVQDDTGQLKHLNDLYYYHGTIYANVWFRDEIAMIAPSTGRVKGWIDLSQIHQQKHKLSRQCAVANGIVVNPVSGNLIVTGKCWGKLYEIHVT